MKFFPDSDSYIEEIRKLVPGYELIHSLAQDSLRALSGPRGRLLVVGCGPGMELLHLAAALPDWSIDAIDPSEAMVEAAQRLIDGAGLSERVTVRQALLQHDTVEEYDAAVCLLVAHLQPDDGARAAFWQALAGALRPNAPLLLAELDAIDVPTRMTWLSWSAGQGCGPELLGRLAGRLNGGFALLPVPRTLTLAQSAGLVCERTLLSALGVSLRQWRRVV